MTISIRPGQCFRTSAFSDTQLDILYNAMCERVSEEHGEPSGETLDYAKRHIDKFPYFGIDKRDLTTFTWRTLAECVAFDTDITSQLIAEFNRMTATASPFPVGTYVVPNGFRYSKENSTEHRYGTNSRMERWERDKEVLTVTSTSATRIGTKGKTGSTAAYHPTELRLATPEEQTAPVVIPRAGDIIKDPRGIFAVISSRVDDDGDLRIESLSGNGLDYLRVSGPSKAEFVILGRFNDDGAFLPAVAQQSMHSDPTTWKEGQRVRCIDDELRYITKGLRYTLIEDATSCPIRGGVRIRIKDNDGDISTYLASSFEAV